MRTSHREPGLASLVFAASAALVLAGCGAVRSAPDPGLPPAAHARSAGAGLPVPSEPSTVALNTRLLAQLSPATGEDLPIGPGDVIEISVFEVDELSGLKLRVPMNGTIGLPLLGPVMAAGLTPSQLEAGIRGRLQQRYMHDPQVSVFVAEQKSQRISVVGAVRRGGVFPMTSQLRLADALALAEGLADDADHVVYLVRRLPAGSVALAQSGQAVPPVSALGAAGTEEVMAAIDLEQLASGRDDLNVPLRAGDVLQVPRAGSYYVAGSVERPGSFFLKGRTTLQQAVTAAGGLKSVADSGDVRIYRESPDGQREILELSLAAIEGGAPAPEVRKNDVIVVGKSEVKAFFFGVADFFSGIFGFSKGL